MLPHFWGPVLFTTSGLLLFDKRKNIAEIKMEATLSFRYRLRYHSPSPYEAPLKSTPGCPLRIVPRLPLCGPLILPRSFPLPRSRSFFLSLYVRESHNTTKPSMLDITEMTLAGKGCTS